MKNIKKAVCILLFFVIFLMIGTIKSNAGSQRLNNLDFNVQLNSDGSMDVTETWDIYISETNTLYKSFKKDNKKYSGISNVKVKEITNGNTKNFSNNYKWEYHVDKNKYYGTENEDGNFEIGWGVGLDNSSATRKYEISYTVEDAVTKYNDYAELYWQFIGNQFEINCKNITGTIYLPSKVANMQDIKVWGHTEDLNGTIYATEFDKIEFGINDFRSGRFVEVRTLFPSNLIGYTKRIVNKDILQTVIDEETVWANEANARRERSKVLRYIVIVGIVIINIVLAFIFIKKTKKYVKINKELKKLEPSMKFEYFRDIPDENATPGEALKVFNVNTPISIKFGNVFSATMLNLALKGYIEITQGQNKKDINIQILKDSEDSLKSDEKLVMNFLKKASKGNMDLKLAELKRYITNNAQKVQKLTEECDEQIETELVREEIINEKEKNEYEKYSGIIVAYIIGGIFLAIFSTFTIVLPAIVCIINAVLCTKIANKINVLTQKGIDKQQEWKGLKKFMEDFSMMDRKEIPELIIWEKYLVYATAFDIADKVIKQLKIVYPNVDEITSNTNTYVYMNLMMHSDFNSSFSKSISSSMSYATSSGSGGGGGFSGGGGGGRWPVAAVAGR